MAEFREETLPPIAFLHGEYRRWHPVHCYLYYTDSGELIARFTIDELRDLKRRENQSATSNTTVSAEM